MKIQFNGPEEETTAFGLTFPKGKLVEIDGLSAAFQAKLQANPVFGSREIFTVPRPGAPPPPIAQPVPGPTSPTAA